MPLFTHQFQLKNVVMYLCLITHYCSTQKLICFLSKLVLETLANFLLEICLLGLFLLCQNSWNPTHIDLLMVPSFVRNITIICCTIDDKTSCSFMTLLTIDTNAEPAEVSSPFPHLYHQYHSAAPAHSCCMQAVKTNSSLYSTDPLIFKFEPVNKLRKLIVRLRKCLI